MKRFVRYFLQGLLVLVPAGVTGYLVVSVVLTLDDWANMLIKRFVDHRIQGIGLPLALAVAIVVGWLMDMWIFRRLWRFVDWLIHRVPVVKSVYSGIRNTLQFLFGEKRQFSNVVMLDVPGFRAKVLGLVTNEKPANVLGSQIEGRVSVYVPMAFNFGGYTYYVERSNLQAVDLPVEDALRFALSGGISTEEDD